MKKFVSKLGKIFKEIFSELWRIFGENSYDSINSSERRNRKTLTYDSNFNRNSKYKILFKRKFHKKILIRIF